MFPLSVDTTLLAAIKTDYMEQLKARLNNKLPGYCFPGHSSVTKRTSKQKEGTLS